MSARPSDRGRCSDVSATVGEQLAGSAPEAVAWVALEQNGPWGAKAFTDSHLDPGLGRELEQVATAHRSRPMLVRRPGRHPDEESRHVDPRTVLVAWTHPAGVWLLEGLVADPTDVLHLDWDALQRGDHEAVRASMPSLVHSERSHLLVCTNGTRDLCCATKGRPLALAVAAHEPERTWEASHTSGHRFAPTTVLLPTGELHGRLDLASARRLLQACDQGRSVLEGGRGRSTWPAAAQVAELAVREHSGELGAASLWVSDHRSVEDHAWVTEVAHLDGRSWRVQVRSVVTGTERAESCAKTAVPLRRWTTSIG